MKFISSSSVNVKSILVLILSLIILNCNKVNSTESNNELSGRSQQENISEDSIKNSLTNQNTEADLSSQQNPQDTTTKVFEGYFKEVSFVEGSLSLLFTTDNGDLQSFNHFSIDTIPFNLYTVESGQALPVYTTNKSKVGKKYKITFKTEMSDDNGAGEPMPTDFVIAIEYLEK